MRELLYAVMAEFEPMTYDGGVVRDEYSAIVAAANAELNQTKGETK